MPEADKTHAVTILKTVLQLYIPTSFKSTRSGFLQKHGFPEEYKSKHMRHTSVWSKHSFFNISNVVSKTPDVLIYTFT